MVHGGTVSASGLTNYYNTLASIYGDAMRTLLINDTPVQCPSKTHERSAEHVYRTVLSKQKKNEMQSLRLHRTVHKKRNNRQTTLTFHIMALMSGAFLPYGARSRSEGEGLSVARARAAMVSIMRLTHSSWTGLSGDSPSASVSDPTKASTTAT